MRSAVGNAWQSRAIVTRIKGKKRVRRQGSGREARDSCLEVCERLKELHDVELHHHKVSDCRLALRGSHASDEQSARHPKLHRDRLPPIEQRKAVLRGLLQSR